MVNVSFVDMCNSCWYNINVIVILKAIYQE